MYDLVLQNANAIPFVLVDGAGVEVTGLGDNFSVALSLAGGAFGAGVGTKAELGAGWYVYTATIAECSTAGLLALKVTAAGAVQCNLVFRVGSASATVAVTRAQAARLSYGQIAITTYNSWRQVFTSTLTDDLSTADYLGLAIKTSYADDDDAAVVLITAADGLAVLNAEVATDPTAGSLQLSGSSGAWEIAATLTAEAVAELAVAGPIYAEIKAAWGAETAVVWADFASILPGLIRHVGTPT